GRRGRHRTADDGRAGPTPTYRARDQRTVVSLRDLIHRSRRAKAVHDPEADGVLIEYRLEDAANGAPLGPHLDPLGLLVPIVVPVGADHVLGELAGIVPGRDALEVTGFIDDPFPRDLVALALFLEQPVHRLHVVARHRLDQTAGEELVSHA